MKKTAYQAPVTKVVMMGTQKIMAGSYNGGSSSNVYGYISVGGTDNSSDDNRSRYLNVWGDDDDGDDFEF